MKTLFFLADSSFESHISHIWFIDTLYFTECSLTFWPGWGRSDVHICKFLLSLQQQLQNPNVIFSQENAWLNLDSSSSRWLNSDSSDIQCDWTLTWLNVLFLADLTLTRLIWVRVESKLTHDLWSDLRNLPYTTIEVHLSLLVYLAVRVEMLSKRWLSTAGLRLPCKQRRYDTCIPPLTGRRRIVNIYSLTAVPSEVVISYSKPFVGSLVKGTNRALKKPSNTPEIYAKMFGRFHWSRL